MLTISNEEMNYILKFVKSLKKFGLWIKSVSKTIQNEANKLKGRFLNMLLGTLGASLLGNLLTGKGVKQPNSSNIPGREVMNAGECTIRSDQYL